MSNPPQGPSSTRAQAIAYRCRWALLTLAVLCLAGVRGFLFWDHPANLINPDILIVLGVFFLLQWLFLRPRGALSAGRVLLARIAARRGTRGCCVRCGSDARGCEDRLDDRTVTGPLL